MTAIPSPLFATRREVEAIADLLAEVIQMQARLAAIVERLTAPADTLAPSGARVPRPGLRLVE